MGGQAARRARESHFRIFTYLLAHTLLLYTDGQVVAGDLSHSTTTIHLRPSQHFRRFAGSGHRGAPRQRVD